ncbi:ankyrin repeat domain-containing protein [Nesterenkonia sp. HG001]|uniref:ankyrin repeat domain-containing protein n=1 Tax=Nesterenkonia sp. HG001 TaxID=2983207 RepID=UPI002AC5930B|nr:ankyrin repeat domain-containing protein [Nesterenkonia sp. HG001]MDZ5078833.1 ankyrin repeat domain-containing protein [Nesterenkonia sp. HG001]
MPHDPSPDTNGVPELTDEQLEFLNSMFDLARQGRDEELLGLIDQGIPVNLANSKGDTLLILATYNNHAALVEGLISRDADVDRLNDRGQSALTCAVFLQNEETVRMLLAAGADPRHEGQNAYAAIEMFGLDTMRAVLDSASQD